MQQVPDAFEAQCDYAAAFELPLLEETRAGVQQALEQLGTAAVHRVVIHKVGRGRGGQGQQHVCMRGRGCG